MRSFLTVWIVLALLIAAKGFSSEREDAFEDEDRSEVDFRAPQPWYLSDLTITNISAPVAVGGGRFQVQVTVKNLGRGGSGASNLLFRDNNNGTGEMRQIGRLAGRQSVVASFLVGPPENQGPWYFSAIADYGNAIHESNETNNVRNFYQ